MRITAKIATAGVSGLSRFPAPNASIDECLTPDEMYDHFFAALENDKKDDAV